MLIINFQKILTEVILVHKLPEIMEGEDNIRRCKLNY